MLEANVRFWHKADIRFLFVSNASPATFTPKRKFKTLLESFTEGSKNVRHLPRYLSI
jgi:hypothetical protein